jgi:hypothetical protein
MTCRPLNRQSVLTIVSAITLIASLIVARA